MLKIGILAVMVGLFAGPANGRVLSLSTVVAGSSSGLDDLDPSPLADLLDQARRYAIFRKSPKGDVGYHFRYHECDPLAPSNTFCSLLEEEPTKRVKEPPLPLILRKRFVQTLLTLDAAIDRTKACKVQLPVLTYLFNQPYLARIKARLLYWMWTCQRLEKNSKAVTELRNRLWQSYPFDHHTFEAMLADGDARLSRLFSDNQDVEVETQSADKEANAVISQIEALDRIGEDGAAAEIAKRNETLFRKLEPKVQMYIVALLARVSAGIPSVLPISRRLVPYIAQVHQVASGRLVRLLFPLDYKLYNSVEDKDQSFGDFLRLYDGQLDLGMLAGLIYYESAINPAGSSRVGASGLTQIMEDEANKEYREWTHSPTAKLAHEQIVDPLANLEFGVRLFLGIAKDYNGDVALTLAGYNAGEPAVNDWLNKIKPVKDPKILADILFMDGPQDLHISDYVLSVMGKWDWYSSLYPTELHAGLPEHH